jgi:cobyrinic acid a,c-diamide synthase
MAASSSRLVIAGLSGDSGKTIASLSFVVALRRKGFSVSVFKKGPDYIDPAWLSMAAQKPCRSLDTFMVDRERVRQSFVTHADKTGFSIIEGNRGLYDGRDVEGTHSTAELAKLIGAPVILVAGAAKTTRTLAAIVKGCVDFDPGVNIAGVILNRVAGDRHVSVITRAIDEYCGLPVLGAIPKLGDDSRLIPGRHLGLVTPSEYGDNAELNERLNIIARRYLDVDEMMDIAASATPLVVAGHRPARARRSENVRIGYFSDSVFTFYYPENLEALQTEGAELVPVSSLEAPELPEIDALYIGGGFPETHAEQLAGNRAMMKSVRNGVAGGLPVYAECGGLIYLARSLKHEGRTYRMSGVFPVDLEMHAKPVGHGYTKARVVHPNPFYDVGTEIRGHEFHYTGVAGSLGEVETCFEITRGTGLGETRDGLIRNNTLACYTHVHADGTRNWASSIVTKAAEYAKRADGGSRR